MAPFKMKGFSPFHQEEKKMMKKTGKKATPKHKLAVGTLTDGTKEYFKIGSGGDKIKISKSEYDRLKGN